MTKALTPTMPTEKSKKQRDNTKTSITQRLRTNLGRSVRVKIATQLVWLTSLRDPNLPTYLKSCVIKRTHIEKFVNDPPYKGRGPKANQSREAIKFFTTPQKKLLESYWIDLGHMTL